MYKIIVTLLVACAGGIVGIKLKIPAGALIGAMISVAIYNIYGGQADIPKNFKLVAQMVVGGLIGLNFTMQTFIELKKIILPTIILVCGLMIFSVAIGYLIYRFTGMDLVTAMFSSAPGGLADMTLISEAYGADVPKVVAMHTARLVTVLTILPVVIKLISEKAQ
ncbi:AbrB family transcriptional regulator [Clostridium sp. DL1XJH146]